jgi:hypothetical protein
VDPAIVLAIEGRPGATFRCTSDWIIRKAVRNLRDEFVFIGGAIKLNRKSLDADQTFAEEIRRITGEGIETLRFDGEKIISQRQEFIFSFLTGRKNYCFYFLFRSFR